MGNFTYGKALTLHGVTWYCQSPGTSWKTDPILGWELYNTDGGWLLIGPEYVEVSSYTDKLRRAMEWAGPIVKGDRKPFEYGDQE